MKNIELEYEIVNTIVNDWEPFLFSKDIYWALNLTNKNLLASDRRIRATAGRLLLAVFYLENYPSPAYDQVFVKFNQLKNQWLSNWKLKVESELPARIRQWGELCKDLRGDTNFSNAQLKNHIQVRLLLDLLLGELDLEGKEVYNPQVLMFDRIYKLNTSEGGFLWDEEVKPLFPEDQYWYLYREFNSTRG